MEKSVYVVTRENAFRSVVLGIYTEALLASNAVWALTRGSVVGLITEEPVGTRYTVLNPETNEEEEYYIEKVTLNERLW